MLTMDYLTGIEGRNQSKKDRAICYDLINENVTIRFFRSQGYEIINLSVFQVEGQLPVAPSNFILTGRDRITSSTFLSRLDRDIRFNLVTRYKIPSELRNLRDFHENSINTLFRKTKEAATNKKGKPRFIYTHLMLPHYPYLYDRNGNETVPEMVIEGYQVEQSDYTEYLQYANKKYLELVDHILASSSRPPIIILMGDHGFRHFTETVEDRYHFMNLNAVYLPNGGYERFYPGMSAVNQFRVILNTAFRQQLPLLKDSTSLLIE
jgi:hypothetical protein